MSEIQPVDVQAIAEEYPNSRFKITNVAILNPGVCLVCGSAGGDGRQFVDFGKTVDFYGVIYVCTFCLAEAAQILGMGVSQDEHIADLNNSLSVLDGKVWELREQLNAARILLRNCTCCDDDNFNPRVASDVEAEPESESDAPESEEGDSGSDDSGDVEGFDDGSDSSGDTESPAPRRRRSTKSAE